MALLRAMAPPKITATVLAATGQTTTVPLRTMDMVLAKAMVPLRTMATVLEATVLEIVSLLI